MLLVWLRKSGGRQLTRFGGVFYRSWWQDSGLRIVWLVQGLGFRAGFECYDDCVSPECRSHRSIVRRVSQISRTQP